MIFEEGRWLLSLKEVAAVVGIMEKDVRNEASRQIIVSRQEPRGKSVALRFDLRATFYFYVVRHSPLSILPADRTSLYRLLCSRMTEAGPWKRVPHGVCHSGLLTLWFDGIFARFCRELLAYRRGIRRMASSPQILGGEPVFRGTRISVRHVGAMALRGVPVEEILTDFPGLGPADVTFARIFAAMKPGPGRPAKARLQFTRLPLPADAGVANQVGR